MGDIAAYASCHGLAVAHGWHFAISSCAAVGVCDVVGVFVSVDNCDIGDALALLVQSVSGLKRVFKGCFVACCGAWGNPEYAYPVDNPGVMLVETISDFCVYVLG